MRGMIALLGLPWVVAGIAAPKSAAAHAPGFHLPGR